VQPNRDKAGQKSVIERAAAIGRVGTVRLSSFQVVDADTRVRMIGAMTRKHGSRWAAEHAEDMRWLAAQRVSIEQAQQRDAEWLKQELSDPFWVPANKKE
jgi:hypothetical protein